MNNARLFEEVALLSDVLRTNSSAGMSAQSPSCSTRKNSLVEFCDYCGRPYAAAPCPRLILLVPTS